MHYCIYTRSFIWPVILIPWVGPTKLFFFEHGPHIC